MLPKKINLSVKKNQTECLFTFELGKIVNNKFSNRTKTDFFYQFEKFGQRFKSVCIRAKFNIGKAISLTRYINRT